MRVKRNQLFTSTPEPLLYLAVSAKFLSAFHWQQWGIYLALTLTAPLIKYTGPAPCSVNSLELHGSSWCLCLPLFRTPSRGLEVFGDAETIVERPLSPVKTSLSSSEEGRGRWARGDGCWEVAADRSTACSERCCSSFPFPSSPPDQGG